MSTIIDSLDARIGARIRIERENRGWSLTDLARRSGVSRAMINKVERGEASPTASLLGRLAGAFGLTLSMLLARTETDHKGRLVRDWLHPSPDRPGSWFRHSARCGPGRASGRRVSHVSSAELCIRATTHLGVGRLPHLYRRGACP